MKKLFAFLFLLMTGFASQAADMNAARRACSRVDLRQAMGDVRSQGNIGWCYANAAADLLSYRYRRPLQGKQVSAVSVALEYNSGLFFMDPFGEGGSSAVAIYTYLNMNSRHNNLCLQQAEDMVLSRGLDVGLKQKMKALQDLKVLYDAQLANAKYVKPFQLHWNRLKEAESVLFTIPEPKLMGILHKSDTDSFPMMIKAELCKGRSQSVKTDDVKVRATSHWIPFVSQSDVINEINSQLSRNNILGVSYYASILESASTPAKKGTEHASVLIGRQWNESANECEYLIRNSWGARCNGYDNSNVRCEDGNFWIRESHLKQTLFSAVYLEAEKVPKSFQSK